jgi:hypothetical protein
LTTAKSRQKANTMKARVRRILITVPFNVVKDQIR